MTSLAALSTGMRARFVGVVPPVRGKVTLWLALAFWVLVVVCALWPSLLAPGDPLAIQYERVLHPPSWASPLGTDHYGRDVLGQIIHGTGVSILVGVVSTVAAVVAGTLVGVVAGYLGGWVDATIMRVIDILLCFPGILLALVFQAALGPGRINIMIAVAVAAAPMYARLVRGATMTQRGRTYVIAARSAGVLEPMVIGRHVLPFLVGPVVSVATIALGTAVVLAASLSFLGLGTDDGVADWGLLIGGGQAYLGSAWWIVTFPGIAIILVVVTAGIIGDALQHRLAEGARS